MTMKSLPFAPTFALFGAALVAVFASCNGSASSNGGDPNALAVVDGFEVSEEHFRAEMKKRAATSTGPTDTPEMRKEVIEDLVRYRALLSRALAKDYDKDPEVVSRLQKLVVSVYEERELQKRYDAIHVTDEEVQAYFDKHKANYRRPEMVQAALIEVRLPPNADDATRQQKLARAQQALAEARKLPAEVKDFGTVAAAYSDDGSKDHGGDIGWIAKNPPSRRWGLKLVDAIFAIEKTGDFGPIVTTENGHYVIRLLARRESKGTLDQTRRGDIIRSLHRLRREEIKEAFYAKAIEKCRNVAIDMKRVNSLPLDDPKTQTDEAR